MPQFNKKEVIDALKLEMSIIEGGGYGRSVRTPWRETNFFRDSVTCLNLGEAEKKHPCGECYLIEHVPEPHKEENVPCHYIPLNAKGETIESLDRKGRREDLEAALLEWIRATISRLEKEPD
ncbi:MAG TPA: hypothetical protein VE398_19770 [Acidobacteriota bacterium]|nr:hypothetical protein [Acidobacteriota bacterium]